MEGNPLRRPTEPCPETNTTEQKGIEKRKKAYAKKREHLRGISFPMKKEADGLTRVKKRR